MGERTSPWKRGEQLDMGAQAIGNDIEGRGIS